MSGKQLSQKDLQALFDSMSNDDLIAMLQTRNAEGKLSATDKSKVKVITKGDATRGSHWDKLRALITPEVKTAVLNAVKSELPLKSAVAVCFIVDTWNGSQDISIEVKDCSAKADEGTKFRSADGKLWDSRHAYAREGLKSKISHLYAKADTSTLEVVSATPPHDKVTPKVKK